MIRFGKFLLSAFFLVAFTWLMVFTIINFMLNCQSWDESYWTETSSCVYPSQMLGLD